MLLDRIGYFSHHSCRLDKDDSILVGVSGGPDSLCLLDGLHRLGYRVIAAHLNHQLRSDAEQDAAYVRSYCQEEGIPFVFDSQPVADFARTARLSLEDAARTLRYRFLFAQANLHCAGAVAVGHTADDQVETILLHLLAGNRAQWFERNEPAQYPPCLGYTHPPCSTSPGNQACGNDGVLRGKELAAGPGPHQS